MQAYDPGSNLVSLLVDGDMLGDEIQPGDDPTVGVGSAVGPVAVGERVFVTFGFRAQRR